MAEPVAEPEPAEQPVVPCTPATLVLERVVEPRINPEHLGASWFSSNWGPLLSGGHECVDTALDPVIAEACSGVWAQHLEGCSGQGKQGAHWLQCVLALPSVALAKKEQEEEQHDGEEQPATPGAPVQHQAQSGPNHEIRAGCHGIFAIHSQARPRPQKALASPQPPRLLLPSK